MKVLFLTNLPSPYRVDFFHELGKLCELTVLYELPRAGDRDAKWKSAQKDKSFQEIFMKPRLKGADYAWCPEVTRYLKKDLYDIIVVGVYSTYTGMHAIQYMKNHHIPYLLSADGGFIAEGENPFKKRLKTHFISGAEGYLSTGAECDKYLVYYGADPEKLYHYPFTSLHREDLLEAPLSEEEKIQLRENLGIPAPRMLLYTGRFIEGKGIDVLMQAATMLRRACEIWLIGGEPTPEYLRLVHEYALENIHFLPFMTGDVLKNYYMAADLLVFPTRSDVWGLVVNEAMAAGVPVVTTDKCIAGMELLTGCGAALPEEKPESDAEKQVACGRVVPVGNARKLADAVNEIMEDDALRQQMGEAALETIRGYTVEQMAQTHMEIFGEIKNGRSAEN